MSLDLSRLVPQRVRGFQINLYTYTQINKYLRSVFLSHVSCLRQVAGMLLPAWMLRACLWLLCIGEVCAATFKLALIGPWSCDPMFSRAMPTAAANLALSRIQSDDSLSRGFSFSIKLLEEDCSASKGESTSFFLFSVCCFSVSTS